MTEMSVLVEARREYIDQLGVCLSEHLIESFDAMYNEASKMSKGKKVLVSFQSLLKDVPNFSNSMIKQHTDAIIDRCSYFSDLLAAVFVASTKIMSSVRLRQDTAKISLKLPTNDIFIHTVFIEAAKNLYADPYVFHDDAPQHKRDEDLRARFGIAIERSVKSLIPIKEILETYMAAPNGESDLEKNIDLTDQGDTEDPDVVESEDDDEEDVEEEDEDDIGEEGPEGLENEMKTIPTVEAPPEQAPPSSEFTQPPPTPTPTPTQAQAPVINEFGTTAPPPRPQTPIPEQQPTLFDGAPDARIRRR
jgi:hypothetical protein